jgi:20S proteasome subunit alpha 7
LRGKDGVVFAVEKLVTSKLYEAGANRRIFNIDTHIGMASPGKLFYETTIKNSCFF